MQHDNCVYYTIWQKSMAITMNGDDDDDDNAETIFENINKLHSCSLLLL